LKRATLTDYLLAFIRDSKSVGIVLFACTILSILLANLPIGESYIQLFNIESDVLHNLHLPHSPLHFINDALMAVFFFLAGMEIKRELTGGELSSFKKAMLPTAAAIGGMLVPALFFMLITYGSPYQKGWGIPMATDIAFSLGVASMLGKRFPTSLKIFLTALAIIDDLGAILVIAFFYGGQINLYFLLGAALVVIVLFALNKSRLRFGFWNWLLGIMLWYLVYNSGIHATIAGVAFAMLVPSKELPRLEHAFHKYVNFLILPLFALANTAIQLPSEIGSALASTLSIGIIAGLFLGKPIGICLAIYIMVKTKLTELPYKTSWKQLWGMGLLAGIGFTMSIFIASLAFSDAVSQDTAKVAILLAVLLSVVTVFIWFSKPSKINKSLS